MTKSTILLTGATGYIGGRLLNALQEKEYSIRCLARKPEYLQNRVSSDIEIVGGDVLNPESLLPALENIDVAFYMIHSMGVSKDFENMDRIGAQNFSRAAVENGIKRIIYLGGLGRDDEKLSPHLHSRQEVGKILRQSGVPTLEFRASIVIGAGSLSFELIRALVERLPVMITPRWVSVPAQPIYIDDLLDYLLAGIDLPLYQSQIVEIGGADQVSYGELMNEYARQRGLRRFMIPVPVLTPKLSSLWLGLVTPVYARVGRKLIDSIQHPTVVNDPAAQELFPIKPIGYRDAIAEALKEDKDHFFNRWSDALSSGNTLRQWGGVRFGTRIVDTRSRLVDVPPQQAFKPIQHIGGKTGWYYGNLLWKIRGWIDLLVGGIGLRRGRRDAEDIRVGDAIDFWRVEDFIHNQRLRLMAEMKVPGRAWLEFQVKSHGDKTEIIQTAIFDPVGLGGWLYWYALYPAHYIIFVGMLRNIAKSAEQHSNFTSS